MRRGLWMVLVGLALGGLGCDPPADALVSSCVERTLLTERHSGADWKLRAEVVSRRRSLSITPGLGTSDLRLEGTFRLARGRVAVVVMACETDGKVVVEAGQVVKLGCDMGLFQQDSSFSIDVFALGGDAAGLEAELAYEPR